MKEFQEKKMLPLVVIILLFCCISVITFMGIQTENKLKSKIEVLRHENDSLKTIIDTLKKPNIKIFLEQR